MPNTFMMQEIIRQSVDQYYDGIDEEVCADAPVIFTVAKGACIEHQTRLQTDHA
jgi:hypothetical protein